MEKQFKMNNDTLVIKSGEKAKKFVLVTEKMLTELNKNERELMIQFLNNDYSKYSMNLKTEYSKAELNNNNGAKVLKSLIEKKFFTKQNKQNEKGYLIGYNYTIYPNGDAPSTDKIKEVKVIETSTAIEKQLSEKIKKDFQPITPQIEKVVKEEVKEEEKVNTLGYNPSDVVKVLNCENLKPTNKIRFSGKEYKLNDFEVLTVHYMRLNNSEEYIKIKKQLHSEEVNKKIKNYYTSNNVEIDKYSRKIIKKEEK